MGTLYYGGEATPIDIHDRALAHLKVIIATKLRRGECFTLSWQHPDGQVPGRSTIWLHPSIPLRFVFNEPEPAKLNRQWIDDLARSANSSGGIMLIAEHLDTGPVDIPEPAATELSVGKLQVDELSIDKLTVAGVDLPTGDSLVENSLAEVRS